MTSASSVIELIFYCTTVYLYSCVIELVKYQFLRTANLLLYHDLLLNEINLFSSYKVYLKRPKYKGKIVIKTSMELKFETRYRFYFHHHENKVIRSLM
jgi:hypothetical protein